MTTTTDPVAWLVARTDIRVTCPDCAWPLRGWLHNTRLTIVLSDDAKAHLLEHAAGVK